MSMSILNEYRKWKARDVSAVKFSNTFIKNVEISKKLFEAVEKFDDKPLSKESLIRASRQLYNAHQLLKSLPDSLQSNLPDEILDKISRVHLNIDTYKKESSYKSLSEYIKAFFAELKDVEVQDKKLCDDPNFLGTLKYTKDIIEYKQEALKTFIQGLDDIYSSDFADIHNEIKELANECKCVLDRFYIPFTRDFKGLVKCILNKEFDSYMGSWANGKPNGTGEMRYSGGDVYTGELKDGIPCGQGIILYSGGDKYEGEFVIESFNPILLGQMKKITCYLWDNG